MKFIKLTDVEGQTLVLRTKEIVSVEQKEPSPLTGVPDWKKSNYSIVTMRSGQGWYVKDYANVIHEKLTTP